MTGDVSLDVVADDGDVLARADAGDVSVILTFPDDVDRDDLLDAVDEVRREADHYAAVLEGDVR